MELIIIVCGKRARKQYTPQRTRYEMSFRVLSKAPVIPKAPTMRAASRRIRPFSISKNPFRRLQREDPEYLSLSEDRWLYA